MEQTELRIAELEERLAKLSAEHKKNPTTKLELEICREGDLLRHLKNANFGDAKSRSLETAEAARAVALSRAIQET